MIFQALGSSNNFRQSIALLFSTGTTYDSRRLKELLQHRYGGNAYLYAKGRFALAAAIKTTRSKAVAINGFTCSVVVDAVRHSGATPVYIDVAEGGYHYSAEILEKALKKNTDIAAVVVQNTFGIACDIRAIEKITKKYGCVLIEDLAHSIGQTYADGREMGTVGDLVMVSFGRDKLIDIGNGGALIVRNPAINQLTTPTQHIRLIDTLRDRWYPLLTWVVRMTYPILIGKILLTLMYRTGLMTRASDGSINTNLRLSHWKAKQILRKVRMLDQNLSSRRHIVQQYNTALRGRVLPDTTIRAVLEVDNPNGLRKKLRSHGLMFDDTWYDTPIGPARKYGALHYPEKDCPNALRAARTIVNLPTHQYVTPVVIRLITQTIEDYV